jgi:hypothetical protein
LISPNFPNYLYSDDALNMKNGKYSIKDDFKKIKISINGVEYNSITQAANELNMRNDSISMRLKSASYKDWIYLDDRRQTLSEEESRPIKNKKISIDGIIYESIAEAVRQTGIDRQIMRYRLKSKNHENYRFDN